LINRLRRRWRCESGAELIEFALTFPLLLLVVMGIIDFGFMFRDYEVITNAAREGARVRVLPAYTAADATARVNAYLTASGLNSGLATVNPGTAVAVNLGGKCMSVVDVHVSYPHSFDFLRGIASYFGGTWTTKTLNATSTMRTEAIAAACP
jgi:Flp pilus assembly protein TadG